MSRDISLEACVLDLIDNSLDSYLLKYSVPISRLIFDEPADVPIPHKAAIAVACSERQIKVTDTCGGISRARAMKDVFCFGHLPDDKLGRLGAYGVGLKRALFKIGNRFQIISRAAHEGFQVDLKLDEWAANPEWKIPISFTEGSGSEKTAGTSITITELHEEVKLRIQDGGVQKDIFEDAGRTYPFFIDRCVALTINGQPVPPNPITLGESDGVIRAAREKFEHDGVRVSLAASVAPASPTPRTAEQAGWNVLCNGRAVVRADKTRLTGWGTELPSFHSKYTSFVGLASLESDDPLSLPWTTTKRDINRESAVFMRAKAVMAAMSKPIITMLNARYPSEPTEVAHIRSAVSDVKAVSFREVVAKPAVGFLFSPPKKTEKKTARIVFDASLAAIEKVRHHLKRPTLSPSNIGKLAFEHYVRTECGE